MTVTSKIVLALGEFYNEPIGEYQLNIYLGNVCWVIDLPSYNAPILRYKPLQGASNAP